MTGDTLWRLLLEDGVSGLALAALVEDAGRKHDLPGKVALPALMELTAKIRKETKNESLKAMQVFSAMKNAMPGIFSRKAVLMGLAFDWRSHMPFHACKPETRALVTRVATVLPALPSLKEPPDSTTPGTWTLPSLTKDEQSTVRAAVTSMHKISDTELAVARNFAARAGMHGTVAAFENEITRRRSDPSAGFAAPVEKRGLLAGLLFFTAGFLTAVFVGYLKGEPS